MAEMMEWDSLAEHGLGRMRYLLSELECAPHLGREAGEILGEETEDLRRRTIREIGFDSTSGEHEGSIRVMISDDGVVMEVRSDHPSSMGRWNAVILSPEDRETVRRYEAALG